MRTLLPLVAGIVMIASSFAVANEPPGGGGQPAGNVKCAIHAVETEEGWVITCIPRSCEGDCGSPVIKSFNGQNSYSCPGCEE